MLNRASPDLDSDQQKDNDKSKGNDKKGRNMHDGCPPKGKGCNAHKGKKIPNAWLAGDECILPNEPNLTLPYYLGYSRHGQSYQIREAQCEIVDEGSV